MTAARRRTMWRGWVMVAALGLGLGMAACGLEQHDATFGDDDPSGFSAERLGTADDSLVSDALTPAEREALARQRGERLALDDGGFDDDSAAASTSGKEGKDPDSYGKAALSFLTVAVTLGAAAAPYLLF